LTVNILFS